MNEVYVWSGEDGTSTLHVTQPGEQGLLATASYLLQSEFGRGLTEGDKVCIKPVHGPRQMLLVCKCLTSLITIKQAEEYGICASCFQKEDTTDYCDRCGEFGYVVPEHYIANADEECIRLVCDGGCNPNP